MASNRSEALMAAAAERGDAKRMKELIQKGADVNITVRGAGTLLMLAAQNGNDRCVEVLIEAGADVNKQADVGYKGLTALADLNMASDYEGKTALIVAVNNCKYECVKLLVEAGADVNTRDGDGATTLIKIVSTYQSELVKLLIRVGADVNTFTNDGQTALMRAAFHNYEDNLKLLLEAGADVNPVDHSGQTALSYASERCHYKCVELLMEAGAGLKIVNDNGGIPLKHVAKNYGHIKLIRMLLRAGAKINVVKKDIEPQFYTFDEVPIETIALLYAAGETIDGTTIEATDWTDVLYPLPVPDYLFHEDFNLNLRHSCRETIRNHLITIDPHTHLFYRIPQLGLPSSLVKYLLYNESLDDHVGANILGKGV